MRADKLVQKKIPQLSKRVIEEAFADGWVKYKNRKCKKGDFISDEKDLDVSSLQSQLQRFLVGNPDLSFEVIAENEDLWVVDKPAGVPSHSLSLKDENTPAQWALAQTQLKKSDFNQIPPEISPHRLDTGTSGLLIVCKNRASFLEWRQRFHEKRVIKRYLAWCFGEIGEEEREVETAIAHSKGNSSQMVAIRGEEAYRPPILIAKSFIRLVKKASAGISLWEISTQTGITHQVRVQMASMGLPLVGDKQYDPDYAVREINHQWHALRACGLESGDFRWEAPCHEFINWF